MLVVLAISAALPVPAREPSINVEFVDSPSLMRRGEDRETALELRVTSTQDAPVKSTVTVSPTAGIKIEKNHFPVELARKGDSVTLELKIKFIGRPAPRDYYVTATAEGLCEPAHALIRYVDLELPENIVISVASGPGKRLEAVLGRLGLEYARFDGSGGLDNFSAVLIGPRALSSDEVSETVNLSAISDYAEAGGTVIVLGADSIEQISGIAPYPLEPARAPRGGVQLEVVHPGHNLFNVPNKLDDLDRDVLARRLPAELPGTYDDQYRVLLEAVGETRNPVCLTAPCGKGTCVCAFFDWKNVLADLEPSAMRLLANLLGL